MQEDNMLDWLQSWYSGECNGDWEHTYGIQIQTLDNPGWEVTIDLKDTNLEDLNIEYELHESSATDWYGVSIKDSTYVGIGDPSKLEFLIKKFKELWGSYSNA